jgi:hypothetical protein
MAKLTKQHLINNGFVPLYPDGEYVKKDAFLAARIYHDEPNDKFDFEPNGKGKAKIDTIEELIEKWQETRNETLEIN